MRRAQDRVRAKAVGEQINAAAKAWDDAAAAEEASSGEPVNIAAAWTVDGVLVVLVRGHKAVEVAHVLMHEGLADPQHKERAHR